MREAEERRRASAMTTISIRLSLVGAQVGCRMKTSLPRTFSFSSLLDAPVSAGFRQLPIDRAITVEPYMILTLRDRELPRASEKLLAIVRRSIRALGPSESTQGPGA